MRRVIVVGLVLPLIACSSGPRGATSSLVEAIEARDADAALAKMVSPDQLDKIISCPTPTTASWLTAADRKKKTDALRTTYASASFDKHVKLGSLFEDYDRATQWHSYGIGDLVNGDCHAKAPFAIEVYRIVIITSQNADHPTESTKPITLWKIDGKYFSWDDPMDTEGWH